MEPHQLARVSREAGAFIGVAAVLIIISLRAGSWGPKLLFLGIFAALCGAVVVWLRLAIGRVYAEITADGVSTRTPTRTRRASWPEISSVTALDGGRQGTSSVKIGLAGGGEFRLGAPISNSITPDPEFAEKAKRIEAAWNQARLAADASQTEPPGQP
jgi:hypothetical protein